MSPPTTPEEPSPEPFHGVDVSGDEAHSVGDTGGGVDWTAEELANRAAENAAVPPIPGSCPPLNAEEQNEIAAAAAGAKPSIAGRRRDCCCTDSRAALTYRCRRHVYQPRNDLCYATAQCYTRAGRPPGFSDGMESFGDGTRHPQCGNAQWLTHEHCSDRC